MNTPATISKPPVRLRRILEFSIVLILIGLAIGFAPRWLARQKLLAETHASAVPTVDTILPDVMKANLGTPLPADVQPFYQAAIHARANGYLKNWLVDIGDHVTNNQTLAEIDTPELDQQLDQAKAELDQAIATRDLAKITADRWTDLLTTASVSEQETAEKKSDLVLKQANVEAAHANVQRLEDIKSFEHVTAPFDGVVTVRNTDIGQLINASTSAELFRVAQIDPLRVYVRVPQAYTHSIIPGHKAILTFQDLPGREYSATITRTAGAVDPSSRTLQVELQVPNPKGEILAGSYAQVRFNESVGADVLTISDNALIFRAQGLQLAVANAENKVELKSVKLGRDFGSIVEVLNGLNKDDRVIVNPPDGIFEGMAVKLSTAETNSVP